MIRHGQACFDAADYDALSPLGERQSAILGESLSRRIAPPQIVVCGGMKRHAQTARQCLTAMGLDPSWEVDAGWDEYDHNDVLGVYDARYRQQSGIAAEIAAQDDPAAAFQKLFRAAVARWTDGSHDQNYRESWPAFCNRVEQALQRVQQRLKRSQTALVFTSGGAISVVCRQLLGLSDERALRINWTLANASVSKLIVGRGGLHLSSFNEHAHLEQAHIDRARTSAKDGLISYR